MKSEVIENPIINSPFREPQKHHKFSDEGITNVIIESRRSSSYFVPIPRPKSRGAQLTFETEWVGERIKENEFINRVRASVSRWRQGGYLGITKTSSLLLQHWQRTDREKRLFFCQIEAMETIIYITEAASRFGDSWIENDLKEWNKQGSSDLFRLAFKMATGSGKTVVMAMLIAWHVLNKQAGPQDTRFSDTFLIVTPGVTIRDRLRVLLPQDPENYYHRWDILPEDLAGALGNAKILVTNFHAFLYRETMEASKLAKSIISRGRPGALTESSEQMVRRACRELGSKKNIVVINDEAHHCYRRKPDAIEEVKLVGDDRKEAEKREEEARVWLSGLEAIKNKIGVKVVYDLSATPFFLKGSGYDEGTLFPWVVSDFSLIDAIESGIVKVPRVPVADDSMKGDMPTYRNIWSRIKEGLPHKGRKTEATQGVPDLPKELEGALQSLYGNYEKYYRAWESNKEALARGITRPSLSWSVITLMFQG